jgi:reductive dehalogenase
MTAEVKKDEKGVSRRQFLKIGGAVAAAAQVGAVAGAGLASGKDPATFTGWQHLGDNTQFVDRKPFEIEGSPYIQVGLTRRPEKVESAFGRQELMMKSIMLSINDTPPDSKDKKNSPDPEKKSTADTDGVPPESKEGMGAERRQRRRFPGFGNIKFPEMDKFPEDLAKFYKDHPEVFELDKLRMESIMPKKMKDRAKYGDYYRLIDAWSSCWGTSERITDPPEISDFHMSGRSGRRGRVIPTAVPFKSPRLASKLIKQVTHHFGATMVGITKLNPDWCYNYELRGSKERGPYEVPKHWEYVIAFGIPHQWDQVQSNPNMGTSFDAYSRATIAARRLENFIKALGYPARRHSPMDGYDLIAVPILVDAGLGQQGRHGIVITPETGSNYRAAFVTTNLPMEIDKPIDFGVKEFCNHCKICAEICPSASISFAETNDGMNTRGYRHWEINQTSCYNFWMQSMGGMGCRLCLIACPYSRKNNWVHALARNVDSKDPTGLVRKGLTWMQKLFFKAPEASEYLPPPDGRFATFREPPEWLNVRNYLDIKVVDPTKGG